MPPTHPTPEEIAREATQALQDCYEYTKAGPNFDREAGAAIILTAARKIAAIEAARLVRESGVMVALEDSSCFWQAVAAYYGSNHLCRDAEAKSLAIRDAALAKLRAISGGQQP